MRLTNKIMEELSTTWYALVVQWCVVYMANWVSLPYKGCFKIEVKLRMFPGGFKLESVRKIEFTLQHEVETTKYLERAGDDAGHRGHQPSISSRKLPRWGIPHFPLVWKRLCTGPAVWHMRLCIWNETFGCLTWSLLFSHWLIVD